MRYINDAMKKNDTPKDGLINRIIELEWDMFDKVTNTGGRAACQDDEWTFYVMRFSQFSALNEAMLQSYEQDLLQAQREGRNMVTEKYGYMMEYTDPAYFDKQLKPALPQVSPAKEELVDRIANLLLGFEKAFDARYPALYSEKPAFAGSRGGKCIVSSLRYRRTENLFPREHWNCITGRSPESIRRTKSIIRLL